MNNKISDQAGISRKSDHMTYIRSQGIRLLQILPFCAKSAELKIKPAWKGFIKKKMLPILALAYFLFITFPPFPFEPIGRGLDNSYRYAINYLPHTNYAFGKDVNFNYGPLGYLIRPLNIGSNLIQSAIFVIMIHAMFCFSIIIFYMKNKGIFSMKFVFSALAYAVSCFLTLYEQNCLSTRLLVLVVLLAALSIYGRRTAVPSAVMSGILMGMLLFIKFNVGFFSPVFYILVMTFACLSDSRRYLRILVIAFSAYAVTVSVITLVFLKRFENLYLFVVNSLELASEFSEGMSLIGNRMELIPAICIIIVFFLFLWLLRGRSRRLLWISLACLVLVFLAFKQGFVRQDAHVLFFATSVVSIASIFPLIAATRRELLLTSVNFLVILILSLIIFISYALGFPNGICDYLCGKRSYDGIWSVLNLKLTKLLLDKQGTVNLFSDALPVEWIDMIKKNKNAFVDIVPWEINYCPTNGLRWTPNPILQLTYATSAVLDKVSASHFKDSSSPEFIIAEFQDIDYRNQIVDYPATWNTILANYKLCRLNGARNIFLLEKRKTPLQNEYENICTTKESLGEWIELPESTGPVYAEIEMRLNIYGRIMKKLFRIGPTYIYVVYEDGKPDVFRIMPGTMKNDVLISCIPRNATEMSSLFEGQCANRIDMVAIIGPGSICYNRELKIIWKRQSGVNLQYKNILNKDGLIQKPIVTDENIRLEEIVEIKDSVLQETMYRIIGHAYQPQTRKPADTAFIDIDGKIDIPVNINEGKFISLIPATTFLRGKHNIRIKMIADNKYYIQGVPFELEVK